MLTPAGRRSSGRKGSRATLMNLSDGRASQASSSSEKASTKSGGQRSSVSGKTQKRQKVTAAAAKAAAKATAAAAKPKPKKRKREAPAPKATVVAADALGIPADGRSYALAHGKTQLTAAAGPAREGYIAAAVIDIVQAVGATRIRARTAMDPIMVAGWHAARDLEELAMTIAVLGGE